MAQVLKRLGMSSTGGLDAISFNRLPVDKRERLFSALASELQGIGGFFSPVESIQSTLGMLDSGVGDMPAAPAVRPTSNVENAPATTQSRYLNPPVKSEVEKEQALAEFRRVTGRDSGPVAAPAVATADAPAVQPAVAPPPMEAALVSQTTTPTPTTVSPSPDVSPLDEGIGSVPTDTETTSEFQNRLNQTLSSLPQIMGQLQQGVPPSGFSMSDLQAFAPTPFDNSESVARKEALIKQIQDTARIRKEEDIAAAEKYRSESEEPIKQLREEARRSAMASALMRLGAGIASGDMAAGLSGASESVENIMTRAREQASAERRAAKQEFRQAEREATRGERSMADTVFQMQAQQITDDENEQRNFARDQKQFAQWAFGMMRDQGKEARQAYTDSLRLSIGVSNAINQTLREEARDKRISENQFLSTFGAVYGRILEVVMERGDTELSPEKIVEMAREQTRQQLAAEGFISPKSGFALKVGDERDGYRYKGGDPSKETSWEKI